MRYYYEIDGNNAVRIWDNEIILEGNAPFHLQPNWPNTTPWASRAEAESWAEAYINSIVNPTSEFLAGDGPDQSLRPRGQIG